MGDLTEFRDLAGEFFADDFFDATLYRVTRGSYDPVNGTGVPDVTTQVPARVLMTSPEEMLVNIEPREDDRITLAGTTYLVTAVTALAPDGVPILYTATVTT